MTQLYPTYQDYLSHVDRVHRGIHRVLHPLKLHSSVELHKRIDPGEMASEWMDVRLVQSVQLDFLRELEMSIGSDHTLMTLECASVEQHVRQAIQHLQQLMHRRVWQSADFLNLINMAPTSSGMMSLGHHATRGNASIKIRYPSGQTDTAPVPNRLTSALADKRYELIYTPLLIGLESALVQLTSMSSAAIGSKSKKIRIAWSSHMHPEYFSNLIASMKKREWTSSCFLVECGRTGAPKRLVLTSTEKF